MHYGERLNVSVAEIVTEETMASTEFRPVEQGPSPLLSEEYSRRALPQVMNTFAMTALFILVLFFITNIPTAVVGGPAGLTLWIVGGVCFFLPCALASAQLGALYPNEGGIYSWTYHIMGSAWSFFVGLIAWLPGPLLIVATGDLFVGYIQNLNSNWLVAPWQQGLVLIGVIAFSGVLCLQRTATLKTIINVIAVLILCAALLIVIGACVWLTKHPSATNFTHLPDWNPFTSQNFPLFGVITLGYLGVNLPLNLAGEATANTADNKRKMVTSHLLWGTCIVLVAYLAVTAAVLIVQGQNGANNLFAMVSTVDMTLGKFMGNITSVCIMATFVVTTTVYNVIFVRFLMVAGFDQRVTSAPGKLNRNRAPSRAVIIQTAIAIILSAILFLVIPYLGIYKGKPADISTIDYFIAVGTGTLLWAFATIFLFMNVFILYFRKRPLLQAHRVVPLPVLMFFCVVGFITGIIAMVDTLFNSYIPPLITNSSWTLFVGLFTLILIIMSVIATPLLTSESSWETSLLERDTQL